jgi:hypothetical protein
MHIPLNAAATLGPPSEFAIGRSVWHHCRTDAPFVFAFQGWTIARASRLAPALADVGDDAWHTIAEVHLTTRSRLVTVVELSREPPAELTKRLVLAAEIHAGWPGARCWLETAADVAPPVEHVPNLRDALEGTLAEAIERTDHWIRAVSSRHPFP